MAEEKKHILVIEDENDVAELLHCNLTRQGYSVDTAARGDDGLKAVAHKPPNLILLDLMVPGMNGLDVCRELRKNPKTADIPIIMVTAKAGEDDILTGLEAGADDYMTKPFSIKILISRVRVALRRQPLQPYDAKTEIRVRDLVISPSRYKVIAKGKTVEGLTLTEFRLLHALASRPGWVLTRQQILDAVLGIEVAVTERAMDVQMVGLRKKLGPYANCVEAVRGVGYRFKDD